MELLWRGRRIAGTVRPVAPEIRAASRTATLVLALPHGLEPLAGETVTLLATERVAAPGFRVPLAALVADLGGLWAVQVAEPGADGRRRILRAPVRVIHTDGGGAYVADPPAETALVYGETAVLVGARMRETGRIDRWAPVAAAAVGRSPPADRQVETGGGATGSVSGRRQEENAERQHDPPAHAHACDFARSRSGP